MNELLSAMWDVVRALWHKLRGPVAHTLPSTKTMNAIATARTQSKYRTAAEEIIEHLPDILDLSFKVEIRLGNSTDHFAYQFMVFVTVSHDQTGKEQTMQCCLWVNEDDFVGGDIPPVTIEEAAGLIAREFDEPEKILRYYAELS